MAVDFQGTDLRAVSIWMGPLLTERALIAAEVKPEEYANFIATAETPQFIGHIVHALANDPKGNELSGHTVISAEIAARYNIKDREGKEPPSYREMLGAPRDPNPAIVK